MTDYVLVGLVKRRADLAGEANALKARIGQVNADIAHLDAVIRQFDPDYNLTAIRPKRPRSSDVAKRGEISRFILGVLRQAPEPMTTAAVVAAVMAARGMDAQDRKAVSLMMGRVGMALRRQERRGVVRALREAGHAMIWRIAR